MVGIVGIVLSLISSFTLAFCDFSVIVKVAYFALIEASIQKVSTLNTFLVFLICVYLRILNIFYVFNLSIISEKKNIYISNFFNSSMIRKDRLNVIVQIKVLI